MVVVVAGCRCETEISSLALDLFVISNLFGIIIFTCESLTYAHGPSAFLVEPEHVAESLCHRTYPVCS